MNQRLNRNLLMSVIVLLIISACNSGNKPVKIEENELDGHRVIVKEVLQGQKYSYFLVQEKMLEYWIATERIDQVAGDTLYYTDAFEMQNFMSKELDREFASIWFVNDISTKKSNRTEEWYNKAHNTQTTKGKKLNLAIDPSPGVTTIAEVYRNKADLNQKKVKVKGLVTRYNEKIMGKNWIHIQDGTDYENQFDLTVTSQDVVMTGDTVILEGILMLDKDFGAGYFYDIILEDAVRYFEVYQ
jgi:hypothetical protein